MEVAEMYPGKPFSKKCDSKFKIQKTANKSANMQRRVIGHVFADINTTFTQTLFQSLSHNPK